MISRRLCAICHGNVPFFRKNTCGVCGNVVCNNCCHKITGIKAIIHQVGNLPVTMCSRCKAIESNRVRSPAPTESVIQEVIDLDWCNSLRSNCFPNFSHVVVTSIVLPSSEVLSMLNCSLVKIDLPQASQQYCYSISLHLNNEVMLTLSLDNLEMSYEKDRWIAVFTPTDQRRLYLHVKYLYLSKMSKGNHSLFQAFCDYKVKSNNYLYLYENDLTNISSLSPSTASPLISELSPSPPVTPRTTISSSQSSSSSLTSPTISTALSPTSKFAYPIPFASYYIVSILSMFFCWCINVGALPHIFRFIFSIVIFSVILIVYPNE